MRKRVLSALLTCCMVVLMMPAAVMAASSGQAEIKVGTVNAEIGETVKVPVEITSNPGIAGVQFDIIFDDAALTLKSVEKGTVLSDGTFDGNAGAKHVQWYYVQNNVTTEGILFTLEFEVRGSSDVAVCLTDNKPGNITDIDSNNVPVSFTAGAVVVEALEETQQDLSFAEETVVKTYGDAAFPNAAVNHSAGGGRITYKSSNTGVAAVDNSGTVTIVGAGTATITATAAAVPGTYLETEASYQLTVNKASAQNLTRELTIRYNNTGSVTCDLGDVLPDILTCEVGEVTDTAEILAGSEIRNGILSVKLKSGLDQDAVNRTATISVKITSANYEDSTVIVTVRVTDQLLPTVSAENITVVYTGSVVPDSRIRGTASYNGQTVPGTWSFKAGQSLTNVRDSGVKTVVFTPNDSETYSRKEAEIQVTITKATPSGHPSYTSINQAGMTLADAKLNTGSITPVGTIAWNNADSTVISANTSYGWTFTPNDTDNYTTLTGSLQPYTVHTDIGNGGSGSSGSSGTPDHGPSYQVSLPVQVTGGTVKVSPASASANQRITLTVKPGYGYELVDLTVTDSKGAEITLTDKGEGKYTFTMPKDKVSVDARFKQTSSPIVPVQPTVPTQTVVVNPTNDKLDVDGTAYSPAAYKIDGYNYFKLRDIAALLNGTEKQFSVGYDSLTGTVTLTSGQPYAVTDSDLTAIPDSAQNANVSTNVVYINGVQTQLTVYKINGYNYFKLRDLASALNFSVDWTAGRGIFIESNKPYSE